MGFIQSVSVCLRKYFTFSGRASRSEFWWFYLFFIVLSFLTDIMGTLQVMLITSSLERVANLMVLILIPPFWAVICRRLHDVGKSGWWNLIAFTGIGIILLMVWLGKGTEQKDNEYGALEQS